ncbi:MAG: nucleotide sugar dehydrogenase [Gammaproteobacteria bacterium]
MKTALIRKLNNKTAAIGVIGLGYVGIPLALRYVEAGYSVTGFDIDADKIEKLADGKSYIKHISDETIKTSITNGFCVTCDYSRTAAMDALIICVPTPLDRHREPDLSYVLGTLEQLLPYLRKEQIVSLESTTYPGTTEEELKPRIEQTGLQVGKDIFLVYSPEREDPGNTQFSTQTIPKICGGDTQDCQQAGLALYGHVIDKVVSVSSTRTAEMTKLLENIHRAVNIGLVNEMKMVADKMDIDIYEVIDAAATKPFGFVAYYPGPGLGGHCIPIDPFYLTWKAREYGINTRFIELAGEVNSAMPDYVMNKVIHGLNRHKKSVNGCRVLVLGIAYKKNVDDMRESPAVEIMQQLQHQGAIVEYSDPYVPVFPKMRRYTFKLSSVELSATNIRCYDCIIIATNHDNIDYGMVLKNAQLIIDTRGVYRDRCETVIRA